MCQDARLMVQVETATSCRTMADCSTNTSQCSLEMSFEVMRWFTSPVSARSDLSSTTISTGMTKRPSTQSKPRANWSTNWSRDSIQQAIKIVRKPAGTRWLTALCRACKVHRGNRKVKPRLSIQAYIAHHRHLLDKRMSQHWSKNASREKCSKSLSLILLINHHRARNSWIVLLALKIGAC